MDHMANDRLLLDVFLLLLVAFFVHRASLRVKLPSAFGLLAAGVLIGAFGPNGFGMLSGSHELLHLAEIGVGFLLLPIGMEFSLDRLKKLWRQVLIGGSLQLVLTAILAGIAYLALFRGGFRTALFVGFLTAMSSTVIVIDRLKARGKFFSAGGQLAVGILIFQDLMLLPLGLLTPMLSSHDVEAGLLVQRLVVGVLILVSTFGIELLLVNPLLAWVSRAEDETQLLAAIVIICLGTSLAAKVSGLSPAFGMFLAGILLSRTESRSEVLRIGNVGKTLFGPLHFLSFGLLLDFGFFGDHAIKILFSAAGLIVIKMITGFATGVLMGGHTKSACRLGGSLAHIGELSFVLAAAGFEQGVITADDFRAFIAIGVVSILISPGTMTLSLRLADYIPDRFYFTGYNNPAPLDEDHASGHVIVFGFGHVGRLIAAELKQQGVQVVVVEQTRTRIDLAKADGHVAFMGDATNTELLDEVAVGKAKGIIFAFGSSESRNLAISLIRRRAPETPLIIRVERFEEDRDIPRDDFTWLVVNEASAATALADVAMQKLGIPPLNPAAVAKLSEELIQAAHAT